MRQPRSFDALFWTVLILALLFLSLSSRSLSPTIAFHCCPHLVTPVHGLGSSKPPILPLPMLTSAPYIAAPPSFSSHSLDIFSPCCRIVLLFLCRTVFSPSAAFRAPIWCLGGCTRVWAVLRSVYFPASRKSPPPIRSLPTALLGASGGFTH